MVKLILILGLLVCAGYAFLQRDKSRLIAGGIGLLSVIGMVLVIQPELATRVANTLGVGRGTDLITYFWILMSVLVLLNLQFKIFSLQRTLTELSREVALRTAKNPPTDIT
jgi:hypothetical protein